MYSIWHAWPSSNGSRNEVMTSISWIGLGQAWAYRRGATAGQKVEHWRLGMLWHVCVCVRGLHLEVFGQSLALSLKQTAPWHVWARVAFISLGFFFSSLANVLDWWVGFAHVLFHLFFLITSCVKSRVKAMARTIIILFCVMVEMRWVELNWSVRQALF